MAYNNNALQQTRPSLKGYSFPVLPADEILSSCRAYQCDLEPTDISHPTPARIQLLYEWWLNDILKITIDDCRNAAEVYLDNMENPDIHRDAMYFGVFQLAFTQLLQAAAMDDFTISDLRAPTPKRVTLVLSCLINYTLFEKEAAETHLQPIETEDAALTQREQELGLEIEKLQADIEEERKRRQLNRPKAEQCEQEIEVLRRELQQMHGKSLGIKNIAADRQADIEKLANDINELEKTITGYRSEINRLKMQVVSSPDRVRMNVADMARALQREKDNVAGLEVKERQLQAKISSLTKYEIDLNSCLKIMNDWEVDAKKLRDAVAKYNEHCNEYEQLVAKEHELKTDVAILERKRNVVEDQLIRLDNKADIRRAANRERKRQLEQQLAQFEERRKLSELAAAVKNREAIEVENQIREIHAALHREVERGALDYKKIRDAFFRYSNRLNKSLDALNALSTKELALS